MSTDATPHGTGDYVGYDIIGDIHGHADALKALLTDMGYRDRARSLPVLAGTPHVVASFRLERP